MTRKAIGLIVGAVVVLSLVGFAGAAQEQRPVPVDIVKPLTSGGAVFVQGSVDVESINHYHLTVRNLSDGQLRTIIETTNPPEVGQHVMLQVSGTLRRAYEIKYIVHMPTGNFAFMEVQAYINEGVFVDLPVQG